MGGRAEDALALAYVHSMDDEYSDPENSYFVAPARIRYGTAGRDYTRSPPPARPSR